MISSAGTLENDAGLKSTGILQGAGAKRQQQPRTCPEAGVPFAAASVGLWPLVLRVRGEPAVWASATWMDTELVESEDLFLESQPPPGGGKAGGGGRDPCGDPASMLP